MSTERELAHRVGFHDEIHVPVDPFDAEIEKALRTELMREVYGDHDHMDMMMETFGPVEDYLEPRPYPWLRVIGALILVLAITTIAGWTLGGTILSIRDHVAPIQ